MGRTQELKDFYKDKTVYITGITGFKGTWLALTLKELGAKVLGIGLDPEENSLYNLVKLKEEVDVIIDDITAPSNHSKYLGSLLFSRPDVVFHLASQNVLIEKEIEPFETFNTNIMGTVITHEILRGLDKKVSLVNSISNATNTKKNTDAYSISEDCSNLITTCYTDNFESEVISSTIRTGTVTGGGEPSLNINTLRKDKTAKTASLPEEDDVHSLHILDVVLAYLTIGMIQYKNSEYENKYTINNKEINENEKYVSLDKTTNWEPLFKNEQKIKFYTKVWYKNYIENIPAKEITKNQIIGGLSSYDLQTE